MLREIGDPDLRLLFVLARWGGLRVISEPRELTWDCVNWEQKRLRVPSPKTERYGHESRVIPLFPELVEPLERASEGETFILPKLRTTTLGTLRTRLLAAIRRAGLEPWPRLWHNLRASRQTDLEQRFPSHVVCTWMGNSRAVASRHYLQVLDSDYEKAAQNAAQYTAEPPGNMQKADSAGSTTVGFCKSLRVAKHPSDPDGI
ncbi:tyrosine-type recombinase/integrase [Thermostilla marina]